MPDKPSSEKKKGGATTRVPGGSTGYNTQLLNERLARLSQRAEEKFDPKKHKDTKRAHIALVFVYGYMLTVGLVIIGAPLFNALFTENVAPLDIERVLAQIGSLIGAPLGFVIGYYFKEDK